jgi:hypothetical protein
MRLGLEYKLNLENILFSLFSETMYTSFSLVSFLEYRNLNFLQFPFLLISDIINLLPSFLFPEKFLLSYKEIYNLDAPLGAFHSFISFSLNFGVIGTIVCFFIFGFFLANTKKYASDNMIFKLIYVLISGNLAFTFFRDPFSISIIKNILQFSIIIPIIICLFTKRKTYSEG